MSKKNKDKYSYSNKSESIQDSIDWEIAKLGQMFILSSDDIRKLRSCKSIRELNKMSKKLFDQKVNKEDE